MLSNRENILIMVLSLVVIMAVFSVSGNILNDGGTSPAFNNVVFISGNDSFVSLEEAQSIVHINKPVNFPLENPPKIIKAVYATEYSISSSRYLNYLENLFNTTKINAVVIDIKGSSGSVGYKSEAKEVLKYKTSYNAIRDIDSLVKFFHDRNIYLIGRIAVFEDPVYARARPGLAIKNSSEENNNSVYNKYNLWTDNNGLYWLDPASIEVWEYNISIAQDAFYRGFDEINFDYIRFPSDGDMKNMVYPVYDGTKTKKEVITEFFNYLRKRLPDKKISADLFGQTTINKDDMGIGQVIEEAYKTFDYVCPMVYPSHYIDGFLGFENPADYPYEIVKYSLDNAIVRERTLTEDISLAKIRPWLQDFNMKAEYNTDKILAQIQATKDSLQEDYVGFMLWSPYNIYTQGAIQK